MDIFHLPNSTFAPENVKIYGGNSASSFDRMPVWNKPRGINMVFMFAVGTGGGGGGGGGNSGTNTRGGGGSGAAASRTTLLIPAIFLPDTLYIGIPKVSAGGLGQTNTGAGFDGAAGSASIVSTDPGQGVASRVISSGLGAANAGGGIAGSDVAGGGGGSAPSAATAVSMPFGATFGIPRFSAGLAGVAGSLTTGTNTTTPSSNLICPGAGGGGGAAAGSNGGGLSLISNTPWAIAIPGGLLGTNAAGGDGNSAYPKYGNMFLGLSVGGTGGGGSGGATGAAGGRGGHGAWGAGGGGGGGGRDGAGGGGRGGNGGPGLVVIISW